MDYISDILPAYCLDYTYTVLVTCLFSFLFTYIVISIIYCPRTRVVIVLINDNVKAS